MTVRTKELGAAAMNGVTPVVVYTCPAGATAIVKDVCVHFAGAKDVVLDVLRGATAYVVRSGSLTDKLAWVVSGAFIVLEPGDVLRARFTTAGAGGTVIASGSELDGVAP